MSTKDDLINTVEVALTDEVYDGGFGMLSNEQLRTYIHKLAVTAVESITEVDLEGAEVSPAPNMAIASAGEFAAIWNAATPERRQAITDVIMARQDEALACFIEDHDGLKEEAASYRKQRHDLWAAVKKYADDRHAHARGSNNTLSSWRVWGDLYAILGLDVRDKA
ncbi:hypothetical protein SEA_MERCEDES_51 [Microbacterium phage Mercedes]|nr:hypothetical protein SEA_MERCEDES_51 [Microbacterium phage Mercedes]